MSATMTRRRRRIICRRWTESSCAGNIRLRDRSNTWRSSGTLSVPFMILASNLRFAPNIYSDRLVALGYAVAPENIYTSALATAHFVHAQKVGARYFAVDDHL